MSHSVYPLLKTVRRRWSSNHSTEFVPGLICTHPCTAVPITGTVSHSISVVDSVLLGFSSRDWRQAIAAGTNATSTLSGTRHTAVPHRGAYYYERTDPGSCCSYGVAAGSFGYEAFPTVSTSPNSTAAALASEKLLGSYLSAQNTWRGGNFLAEFTETVHMLRHPITSLFRDTTHFVRNVHSIRRLALRKPDSYAKKLANFWLAFVFGWKPLFDDIRDANAAINKLASGTGHDSIPISGRGSVESSTSMGGGGLNFAVGGNYTVFDRASISKFEQKYYGAIRARPESFATVADTFGVNGSDILPAVWEAIPWSFFIDYFVNVQQVVDSWRFAFADLAWLAGGYKNTITTVASDSYVIANLAALQVIVHPAVSGGKSRSEYKSRAALLTLPYPGFRFKIPGIGSLKWANTAALIAQVSNSRPGRPPVRLLP